MSSSVTERSVVIVGGTSGIGRALAELLVEANDVLVIGRSAAKGARFEATHPTRARFLQADMSLLAGVPNTVQALRTQLPSVDFVVHCADLLRTQRLDTAEGLEVTLATNYLSRVLFNQLMVGGAPAHRPSRILHVAVAGIRPPRRFLDRFPLAPTASSLRGHTVGQIANDFYGLLMWRKLRPLGVRTNILNAGTVDTAIRREGQFPWPMKAAIAVMEAVMGRRMRDPADYARMMVEILGGASADADAFALLDSRGRGLAGSRRVNDEHTQDVLYERTTREIDRVLGHRALVAWL